MTQSACKHVSNTICKSNGSPLRKQNIFLWICTTTTHAQYKRVPSTFCQQRITKVDTNHMPSRANHLRVNFACPSLALRVFFCRVVSADRLRFLLSAAWSSRSFCAALIASCCCSASCSRLIASWSREATTGAGAVAARSSTLFFLKAWRSFDYDWEKWKTIDIYMRTSMRRLRSIALVWALISDTLFALAAVSLYNNCTKTIYHRTQFVKSKNHFNQSRHLYYD